MQRVLRKAAFVYRGTVPSWRGLAPRAKTKPERLSSRTTRPAGGGCGEGRMGVLVARIDAPTTSPTEMLNAAARLSVSLSSKCEFLEVASSAQWQSIQTIVSFGGGFAAWKKPSRK